MDDMIHPDNTKRFLGGSEWFAEFFFFFKMYELTDITTNVAVTFWVTEFLSSWC